jgi:hypothetical protein
MGTLLPDWLWWIAGLTGLGGFVDFLIGRAGQQRLRSSLETWWIRFDEVHPKNFGKKEALYAIHIIDIWFGSKFLSRKRFIFLFYFFW